MKKSEQKMENIKIKSKRSSFFTLELLIHDRVFFSEMKKKNIPRNKRKIFA